MGRQDKKAQRLQSAMEYLMTYGWAILIIAVVLGALFGLGFFNSTNLAPKVGSGSCQVYRPIGPGTTSFINLEGTCNNELPQYVAQFNGFNSNIIISTQNNVLNVVSSSLTVSAWIYLTSTENGAKEEIVSQQCDSSGERQFSLADVGQEVNFYVSNTGLDFEPQAQASSAYPLSTWQFVVGTYNGINETIYNNGQQVATEPKVGNIFDSSVQYMLIGGYGQPCDNNAANNYNKHFGGSISNVQIYNTSLSANEVAALYQEGIGGDPIEINNLVGWWPLNGNANDYSGNLNNGVPTNVVYTSAWTSGYTSP